jgi:hypothetical protein
MSHHRQSHISFFKPVLCKGKRYNLRRDDDRKQISVLDQYDTSLMICALIVLGLSMVDAVLTLTLLKHGAVEVNPVMRYCLDLGLGPFVIAKYALTAIPLVVMVMLSASSFLRFRIGSLMFLFSGLAFGAVVIWELHILNAFSQLSAQSVPSAP